MAEKQWFTIVAIGRDRPGIVADLAQCVYDCGCNLEDTAMTALGKEFATLVLVSGTTDSTGETLATAVRRLEWERHLTVYLRPLDEAPRNAPPSDEPQLRLRAVGVDKAGIVAGVARVLAEREMSIRDLRGHVSPAPQSGTPIYTLSVLGDARGTTAAELEQFFAPVSARLEVEITASAEPSPGAS